MMNNEAVLPAGVSLARLGSVLRFASVLGAGSEPERRPPATGGTWSRGEGPDPGTVPFEKVLESLFRLLSERQVRYVLVGGVALLRYVPGRNTEDIDLLLAVGELERLPEIRIHERQEWFARGDFHGLRVDLLFSVHPLFQHVLEQRATVHSFRELDVPCATAEGLILLKLFALPSLYRQGNIQRANLYEADLAALVLETQANTDLLLEELSPHVSASDLRELKNILAEIAHRRQRFGSPDP